MQCIFTCIQKGGHPAHLILTQQQNAIFFQVQKLYLYLYSRGLDLYSGTTTLSFPFWA